LGRPEAESILWNMSELLPAPSDNARYRALLESSALFATETDLPTLLHSLSLLLADILPSESVALLLVDESRGVATLHALESVLVRDISIGTEVAYEGTAVAEVVENQRPLYIHDYGTELEKFPDLRKRIGGRIYSAYYFPLATERRRLGVLIFGARTADSFTPSDVELMRSVAFHVTMLLDRAFTLRAAEEYQRDLARERDRLRLLLDITNEVASHLDMQEVFRVASESVRRFFSVEGTGLWLLNEETNRLRCAIMDFPSGGEALSHIELPVLSQEQTNLLRVRTPLLNSVEELEKRWPPSVIRLLRAESITSIALIPLVSPRKILGVITLGTRRKNAFSQEDLDLLTQIAGQAALALDNALAYGYLRASKNRLEEQRVYLESEIRTEYGFEDIIGSSPALRKVLDQVSVVAATGSTVLLLGETGTGKELIARAIHHRSPRSRRTFVRLNCAAIPSGLIESELFGHEKGAFTGALTQKPGRFELAHEGTLFLDEVGDISLELQPKLLRAIQEQEFERLGSNRTLKVDVRIIAATHRDLPSMIREGSFREDLFYRLNVFPIEVPPLRERREDIPMLVHYFVSRNGRKMQKTIRTVPEAAMNAMVSWNWPGNIRELENFIERAVILTQGDTLEVPISQLRNPAGQKMFGLDLRIEETERAAILAALREAGGKVSGAGGAAELLNLKRTTLQNRMRRLKITDRDYR